jgi:hypothetical protein
MIFNECPKSFECVPLSTAWLAEFRVLFYCYKTLEIAVDIKSNRLKRNFSFLIKLEECSMVLLATALCWLDG